MHAHAVKYDVDHATENTHQRLESKYPELESGLTQDSSNRLSIIEESKGEEHSRLTGGNNDP